MAGERQENGAATRMAPSRASPLAEPLWKAGVEEKRRVFFSLLFFFSSQAATDL